MSDKMRITIEIPNTGLEEDILRKGEWESDSIFGRSLRNALMHFTKESLEQEPKTDVLDKIRAEQKALITKNSTSDYSNGVMNCLNVIDKYRAESEG